ncbi:YsnF/AvaK domain-containing protein [Hymenobacter coccineus]|uniref:DUF2382 domain-containing protein n=1 Tax=Hymenobacter coccineus TaxID=1908235 RepID=A0A1G1TJC2_9BACT|nr:DUF2382 domain-containing protein [Hymenobacter coccineus]OGX90970.1 hypothetical protein BEN49_05680 [Hymenobacter coccineus]
MPELVIPVLVETATVTRELVETGRVRLTKTVQEKEELVPLDLRHDQVQVERVAINRYLPDEALAPEPRHEGDVLIIPVLREVLVKRLLLVEELRVTRQQHTTTEVQRVVLRHEQVQVERLPPAGAASPATPPTFQP